MKALLFCLLCVGLVGCSADVPVQPRVEPPERFEFEAAQQDGAALIQVMRDKETGARYIVAAYATSIAITPLIER